MCSKSKQIQFNYVEKIFGHKLLKVNKAITARDRALQKVAGSHCYSGGARSACRWCSRKDICGSNEEMYKQNVNLNCRKYVFWLRDPFSRSGRWGEWKAKMIFMFLSPWTSQPPVKRFFSLPWSLTLLRFFSSVSWEWFLQVWPKHGRGDVTHVSVPECTE